MVRDDPSRSEIYCPLGFSSQSVSREDMRRKVSVCPRHTHPISQSLPSFSLCNLSPTFSCVDLSVFNLDSRHLVALRPIPPHIEQASMSIDTVVGQTSNPNIFAGYRDNILLDRGVILLENCRSTWRVWKMSSLRKSV